VDEVADATVRCLLRAVPLPFRGLRSCRAASLGELASARFECHEYQIQVTTALGVGIFVCPRHPATGAGDWRGEQAHVLAAQQVLYHRARCNRAARRGEYNAAMETK